MENLSLPAAMDVPPTLPRKLWRWAKGFVVFSIVVFHLVVLAIRNPLDLWDEPIRDWLAERVDWRRWETPFKQADRFTWKYTNFVGCEQRWTMFSPPMARCAVFLGFRVECTDGSSERILSSCEPDPISYFRIGGWQQRKMEDHLVWAPDDVAGSAELPLWEARAREVIRTWKVRHANNPRPIARVVFLRRTIDFPAPDADPRKYAPPEESTLFSFDAEGRLTP